MQKVTETYCKLHETLGCQFCRFCEDKCRNVAACCQFPGKIVTDKYGHCLQRRENKRD